MTDPQILPSVAATIEGEPIAWERPIRLPNGHTITPARVQNAKKDIAILFKSAAQMQDVDLPLEGPVAMTLWFSVARAWNAERGIKDIDNLTKTVLDALNKIGYKDDRQVVELHVYLERGSAAPRTDILVESRE